MPSLKKIINYCYDKQRLESKTKLKVTKMMIKPLLSCKTRILFGWCTECWLVAHDSTTFSVGYKADKIYIKCMVSIWWASTVDSKIWHKTWKFLLVFFLFFELSICKGALIILQYVVIETALSWLHGYNMKVITEPIICNLSLWCIPMVLLHIAGYGIPKE